MRRLDDALPGIKKFGVDTAPIIYFVEGHPQYDALVTEVFQCIANSIFTGVTTVITLIEVLVHPLGQRNIHLQQEYRDLLLHSANFETLPVNITIAERAAELRTRHNLRVPDSIQVAAALEMGCEAFLTNDATLRRVRELHILVLSELEGLA